MGQFQYSQGRFNIPPVAWYLESCDVFNDRPQETAKGTAVSNAAGLVLVVVVVAWKFVVRERRFPVAPWVAWGKQT